MTPAEIEKLLPCPFCGYAANIEQFGDRRRSTIYACQECGCRLETGEENDHGARWNTRTPDLDQATEVASLQSALSHYVSEVARKVDKLAAKDARIAELECAVAIAGPIALKDFDNHPFILNCEEKARVKAIRAALKEQPE